MTFHYGPKVRDIRDEYNAQLAKKAKIAEEGKIYIERIKGEAEAEAKRTLEKYRNAALNKESVDGH